MKIQVELIAKAPIPRWCNTRLVPEIGPDRAARLQETLLQDTVSHVRKLGLPLHVWLGRGSHPVPENPPPSLTEREITWTDEPDLGRLIGKAAAGDGGRILLGADAPHAVAGSLRRAAGLLGEFPAVFAPAEDGGVYVLGVRNAPEDLWTGVSWGTDQVYRRLVSNALGKSIRFDVLPVNFDIDTPADLKRLRALLAARPDLAPETAAFLAAWATR